MIRTLFFENGKTEPSSIPVDEIPKALENSQNSVWVDMSSEDPVAAERVMHDLFHFHPLAIDDALRETHVPKIDDWESYIYTVLHDISFDRESAEIETNELDIFLGTNYLVTYHEFPIQGLERAWNTCLKNDRHRRKGPDHVLYLISDEIVNDFMITVDSMDEEIEQVENLVFNKPTSDIVQKIFRLKRSTLHLRRSLSPLREVFNKMARDDYAVIDERDQIYFRDVYDHLVRLHDISESLRDVASGALDTYLSVINNRMNEVMKTLTIITSLFMPISFLAGFFGMNYFQPAGSALTSWTDMPSFVVSMIIFIGTPLGMFWWMRQRSWI